MTDTIFEYCQSVAQFISYNGNRCNTPQRIENQTIPLELGWNGQNYKVTNCQFLYCNQTFNGFGAICIADES